MGFVSSLLGLINPQPAIPGGTYPGDISLGSEGPRQTIAPPSQLMAPSPNPGWLSALLGANNPVSSFVATHQNAIHDFGAGLASGQNISDGLSAGAQGAVTGGQQDTALATTRAGVNETVQFLHAKGFDDLVPIALAGQGGAALTEAFKRLSPGYGDQTVSAGDTVLGPDKQPIFTAGQTPPPGYLHGPADSSGNPTLVPETGGPADPANPLNVNKTLGANPTGAPLGTTGSPTIDTTADGYGTQPVAGGLTQAAIDQRAKTAIMNGTPPPQGRGGIAGAQNTAISNRMAELGQNANLAQNKTVLKSLSQSLDVQQKYLDNTQRAVNNAEAGLTQLVTAFQGKVNASQYPTVNAALNASNAQFDPGTISAFKAGLTEVGNEYAQVFSRGGQVTDAVRSRANAIANGDLSIPDLTQVLQELHAQGDIVIQGAQDQVKTISDQIDGIFSGAQPAADPTGGYTVISVK